MPVAELFALVRDAIPLHHAARSGNARTHRHSPLHQRFQALRSHLLALNVSIEPQVRVGQSHALKMTAMVTAQTIPCGHCGVAFFSYKVSKCCTHACSNRLSGATARLARAA